MVVAKRANVPPYVLTLVPMYVRSWVGYVHHLCPVRSFPAACPLLISPCSFFSGSAHDDMPPHAALRQVRLQQLQRQAKNTKGRRGLSVVVVFQLMILVLLFLWIPVLQLVTASASTTMEQVEIDSVGESVVQPTSVALHIPPSLIRGNFSVISINKDLGDLGFSGLTNQRCCFFSIVNQAAQFDAVIDVSTVRYRGAWNESDSISHEELYDIDAWNEYVSEHPGTLPYLMRPEDIADNHKIKRTTVAAASIRLELAFVDSYIMQDKRLKELALHFYRAIRPSRGVQEIIDGLQPTGDYGAIHLRVEEDLKTARGFWERRVSVPQVWKRMKEAEAISRCVGKHSGPLDVFVAVSIGDVKDEDDLALLMAGTGPWQGSRIVLDSTKQAAREKYGTRSGIVGALVDFEIARRATIFAAGHFDLSTFSRAIGDTRLREYGDSTDDGGNANSNGLDCRALFFDYNSNRTLDEIFQQQPKPQFWPKPVQWKHSNDIPNAGGIGP